MNSFKYLVLPLLLIFSLQCSALTLAVQPLDDVDSQQLKKVMKEAATKLGALLNEPFDIYYSESWQEFSEGLLAGDFDILYADPHVAAYSVSVISRLHMHILMKSDLQSQYHVMVPNDSSVKFKNISKLCAMPSPRLSNVLVYREFTNPVTQPQIIESRVGKGGDILTNLQKGKCDAVVIEEHMLATANEKALRSVYKTPRVLGKALSLSPRITEQDHDLLRKNFSSEGSALTSVIQLVEGLDSVSMLSSNDAEYAAFNILPGVIWGW